MPATYHDFVFDEIRRVGRAWLDQNPQGDPGDLDVEFLFEKIGELAWRRLVDQKSLRQILLEIGVDPANYLPAAPPIPPGLFAPEIGPLHVDGTRFRRTDGSLFQVRGYSDFLLFHRYARGEDIVPDLLSLRAWGVNCPRIFGALPWKETPDYRIENFPFDQLKGFQDLLEAHGLVANWSIGHYRHTQFSTYANTFCEIMEGRWLILERVNEPHVHGDPPSPTNPLDRRKPHPIDDFAGVNFRGIPNSYGFYKEAFDGASGWPQTHDWGGIHIPRDSEWHRKARLAQEVQHETGKPWFSDEEAKAIEPGNPGDPTVAKHPGFNYTGGKTNPDEFVWHHAVSSLWNPGCTFHCEEGKWGHLPVPGSRQHECLSAVRDHVWLEIDASWQEGGYMGAHLSRSPVDGKGLKINGRDIWTYSSLHTNKALAVRCARSEPLARDGWRVVDRWGPGNSLVRLER